MDFYVYLHKKKTNGEVFYVGKGKNWRATNKTQRNKFWKRVVKKYGLVVEIVEKDIQEWYAHELEKDLIALYGRRDQGSGPLVNLTDGGEGSSGYKHTEKVLGKNHPRFDSRIWKFRNVFTGETENMTQYDFQNKYPNLHVRHMIYKKSSTHGWIVEDHTPQEIVDKLLNGNTGNSNANTDQTIYEFLNLHTKEEFKGSRLQFSIKYGFIPYLLFCNNPRKTFKNWCLRDQQINRDFSPKADYTIYSFIHENGTIFTGTRRDMEKYCGFLIHDLVRKDIKKRSKTIKGWSLSPQQSE